LELTLKKRVELERLKVEAEAIKNWKEKIEQTFQISNDFKSLEINLKKTLQAMENRLRILRSQIKDLD
jgi:archaellum component FlaC